MKAPQSLKINLKMAYNKEYYEKTKGDYTPIRIKKETAKKLLMLKSEVADTYDGVINRLFKLLE